MHNLTVHADARVACKAAGFSPYGAVDLKLTKINSNCFF